MRDEHGNDLSFRRPADHQPYERPHGNREIGFGIAVEILARITQLEDEVSALDRPIVGLAYQDIVTLITKGE